MRSRRCCTQATERPSRRATLGSDMVPNNRSSSGRQAPASGKRAMLPTLLLTTLLSSRSRPLPGPAPGACERSGWPWCARQGRSQGTIASVRASHCNQYPAGCSRNSSNGMPYPQALARRLQSAFKALARRLSLYCASLVRLLHGSAGALSGSPRSRVGTSWGSDFALSAAWEAPAADLQFRGSLSAGAANAWPRPRLPCGCSHPAVGRKVGDYHQRRVGA